MRSPTETEVEVHDGPEAAAGQHLPAVRAVVIPIIRATPEELEAHERLMAEVRAEHAKTKRS